jgi:hypothetical protein
MTNALSSAGPFKEESRLIFLVLMEALHADPIIIIVGLRRIDMTGVQHFNL